MKEGAGRSYVSLPTLLSQILIALTISLDNEFEHRLIPHRTTMGRQRGLPQQGPWLVSWPLWANFMRYVRPEGSSVADLRNEPGVGERALGGNNPGMVRWGYVTLDPPEAMADKRTRIEDMIVRPTAAGRMAQDIWQRLPPDLEPRWRELLGSSNLDTLRQALAGILDQVDVELPRYVTPLAAATSPRRTAVEDLDVTALLSQVLMLFTLDYEAGAGHRLYLAANGLRVIDADGTPLREVPRRAGIGKEAVNLTIGPRGRRFVVIERDKDHPKEKVARLTPEGVAAKSIYKRLPTSIEKAWVKRFAETAAKLRAAAETIVGGPDLSTSPLATLIEPHPDGWRNWIKKPETLPHHPQPNHRGGYPDGV